MKITADDLKELNLIDDVIDEPVMGAHRDRDGAIAAVGEYIRTQLEELEKLSIDEVVSARMEKILSVGAYE